MDYVRKYLSTPQGDQAPNSAETVNIYIMKYPFSCLI